MLSSSCRRHQYLCFLVLAPAVAVDDADGEYETSSVVVGCDDTMMVVVLVVVMRMLR